VIDIAEGGPLSIAAGACIAKRWGRHFLLLWYPAEVLYIVNALAGAKEA
jgi:hypothetical protein